MLLSEREHRDTGPFLPVCGSPEGQTGGGRVGVMISRCAGAEAGGHPVDDALDCGQRWQGEQSCACSGKGREKVQSLFCLHLRQASKVGCASQSFFSVVGSKQENLEMLQGKWIEFAAAFTDQSI